MERESGPVPQTDCRPPRILVAGSLAVGIAFLAHEILVVTDQPWDATSMDLAATYIVVAVARLIGYFAAPFMIGRGQWYSFAAGLLLAPALASWVLMFLPVMLHNPVVAVLAGVSGVVLLALYVFIFRHFVVEFLANRDAGPGRGAQ